MSLSAARFAVPARGATTDDPGVPSQEPLRCTRSRHLLGASNPTRDETFCLCTAVRIPGKHTTWHERHLSVGCGDQAQIVGYRRYRLDECACHTDGFVESAPSPVPVTYTAGDGAKGHFPTTTHPQHVRTLT